jgi:DNA-binding MarR family transcriptional regulator
MANMINQRSMAELAIAGTQGSMLFMLGSGRCLLAAELAREFGVDASAVPRRVDVLEARGLVTRVRSVEDRRVVRLALTPEGQAIATRMPAIVAGVVGQLLSGFTAEEIGFLKSMLRRVLANSGDPAGPIDDASSNSDKKMQ